MLNLTDVAEVTKWPQARNELESLVIKTLGKIPKQRVDVQVKVIDEQSFGGYTRSRVNYFVSDWERVSAWLFLPETPEETPAVLCCHRETPSGKDEPAGLEGDPSLAMARMFAQRGYAALAPDCVTAGERRSNGLDAYDTSSFAKEFPKLTVAGKMFLDHLHAIDLLTETRNVDAERIGVVGHGLGGTNALLLAALDERVQACAASCAFTRFHDDIHPEQWASTDPGFVGVEGLEYMPSLKKAVTEGEFPFDWEHIIALAAPTPLLVSVALNDECLSGTESCEKALERARAIYGYLGESHALEIRTHREGRTLPAQEREAAAAWLDRWL